MYLVADIGLWYGRYISACIWIYIIYIHDKIFATGYYCKSHKPQKYCGILFLWKNDRERGGNLMYFILYGWKYWQRSSLADVQLVHQIKIIFCQVGFHWLRIYAAAGSATTRPCLHWDHSSLIHKVKVCQCSKALKNDANINISGYAIYIKSCSVLASWMENESQRNA